MNIQKVGFTANMVEVLKYYAGDNEEKIKELTSELADIVINKVPKGKHDVDTSDNMLKIGTVPVSFLRNWKDGEAIIMMTTEALTLDDNDRPIAYWLLPDK